MARAGRGSGFSLGAGGGQSDEDNLALVAVAGIVIVVALGSAGLYWAKVTSWMVDHKILVPAVAHPLITLPGGCGLDGPRIVVAAAVLTAAAAAAVSAIRYHRSVRPPSDAGS